MNDLLREKCDHHGEDGVLMSCLHGQEHFADLVRRYSLPIIVLDLVKQHERRRRESIGAPPPCLCHLRVGCVLMSVL